MGKISHLVFIDTETTALLGPESRADAIIELAAARVDLTSRRIVDSFETLIKPWGAQSRPGVVVNAAGVHGTQVWDLGKYHTDAGHFTGANWDQATDYNLALDVLLDRFLIEGATIAGQNQAFDLDHLRRDVPPAEWPKLDYHRPDLCSFALFLVMAGKVESMSLRSVIPWAYADPNRRQAHRAMGDVKDAIKVFFAMFDYFTAGIRPMPDSVSQGVFAAARDPRADAPDVVFKGTMGAGVGVVGIGGQGVRIFQHEGFAGEGVHYHGTPDQPVSGMLAAPVTAIGAGK